MHLTGSTRRATCCLRPSWRLLLVCFLLRIASQKPKYRNPSCSFRLEQIDMLGVGWILVHERAQTQAGKASVQVCRSARNAMYLCTVQSTCGSQGRSQTGVKQESMTPPTEWDRITTITQQSKCQAWSVKSKSHATIESQSQTRWPVPSRGGKVHACFQALTLRELSCSSINNPAVVGATVAARNDTLGSVGDTKAMVRCCSPSAESRPNRKANFCTRSDVLTRNSPPPGPKCLSFVSSSG